MLATFFVLRAQHRQVLNIRDRSNFRFSFQALDGTGICPVCGVKILVDSEPGPPSDSDIGVINVPDNGAFPYHDKTDIDLQSHAECFRNSPKMNFLIRNIKKIKAKKEKAVVFRYSKYLQSPFDSDGELASGRQCWTLLRNV